MSFAISDQWHQYYRQWWEWDILCPIGVRIAPQCNIMNPLNNGDLTEKAQT